MFNLARAAKVVALLLFLLPWVTVSCSPQALSQSMGQQTAGQAPPAGLTNAPDCVLIRASGLDLAMGTSASTPECLRGMGGADSAATPGGNDNNPFASPNYIVIASAVLILLALAASFLLKGGGGAIAAIGGSALAAACVIYVVMVQAPQLVRGSFAQNAGGAGGGGSGGPTPEQLEQIIRTSPAIGFWLVVAALIAAIALNVLAMKGPRPVTSAPPPPTI